MELVKGDHLLKRGVAWPVTLDDGRTYSVAFDRRNGVAVELIPVGERTEYAATHPYELALNLIILEDNNA